MNRFVYEGVQLYDVRGTSNGAGYVCQYDKCKQGEANSTYYSSLMYTLCNTQTLVGWSPKSPFIGFLAHDVVNLSCLPYVSLNSYTQITVNFNDQI